MTSAINHRAALAESGADPVFAAILRHQIAWRVWIASETRTEVRARNEGREVTQEERAASDEANGEECAAMEALLKLPPQTKGGAVAALAYLSAFTEGELPDDVTRYFATLLRSPVLFAEA